MQTREEELNYSLSEFLKLVLPNENRVVYIEDLVTNFLLLDANAKKLTNEKLEKGKFTGNAQDLANEIAKKASKTTLGRVLIGVGIEVDEQGRISLAKHTHKVEELENFEI